ncbi:MAG: hypothetical protein HZA52_06550 [Planctomycetes bacterium]|nr:hypothetical protein [Planctomycetota bacterium]
MIEPRSLAFLRHCAGLSLCAFAGTGVSTTQSAGGGPFGRVAPRTSPFGLSDDFEASQLSSAWRIENPGLARFTQGGGVLTITPLASGPSAIWFNDDEGPLIYKRVTGDFTVSARVHARDSLFPSAPPPAPYRLGGLLARNPNSTSPDLDWVHVALGAGDASAPVAVEDKTTVDSTSDYVFQAVATPDAELRIRRRGASFELAWRPLGAPAWSPLRTHVRPDLPATLDVGLMAYSASTPPRLVLTVDEVVFSP